MKYLIVLVLFCLIKTSHAVGLEALKSIAINHSPKLKSLELSNRASKEEINQYKSEFYPQIELNVDSGKNLLKSNNANYDSSVKDSYRSESKILSLNQLIFSPQKINALKEAEKNQEANDIKLDIEINAVLDDLSNIYFDLAKVDSDLIFIRDSINYQSKILEIYGEKLKTGFASNSEFRNVKYNIVSLQIDLKDKENKRSELLSKLQNIVGDLDSSIDFSFKEDDLYRFLKFIEGNDLFSIAANDNKEIKFLRKARESYDYLLKKELSNHSPELYLKAYTEKSKNNGINNVDTTYKQNYIGLSLSFPIFEGGRSVSKTKQALLKISSLEEDMLDLEKEVRNNLWFEINSFKKCIETLDSLKDLSLLLEEDKKDNEKLQQARLIDLEDIYSLEIKNISNKRDIKNNIINCHVNVENIKNIISLNTF